MSVSQFVEYVFRNLDSDKNGTLSLEEFKQVVFIEPKLIECFLIENSSTNNNNNNNDDDDEEEKTVGSSSPRRRGIGKDNQGILLLL